MTLNYFENCYLSSLLLSLFPFDYDGNSAHHPPPPPGRWVILAKLVMVHVHPGSVDLLPYHNNFDLIADIGMMKGMVVDLHDNNFVIAVGFVGVVAN